MAKAVLALSLTIVFIFDGAAQELLSGEIERMQDKWGVDKKELVREFMNLNQAQAEEFWPLYEDYQDKRKKLGKKRMELVQEYTGALSNFNDDYATELTNKLIKSNINMEKLHKKYFKKIGKATSPTVASRFIQIENYFDTMMELEVQERIPFVGEMSEKVAR